MGEFREFILTAHPRADASIQPSLYHLHVERSKVAKAHVSP
ncbi:hypothetical protein PI125_g20433 [Phytophthora idaei]|nr:hypothetical protein PI125_g20433 [Phytophthora idaei]KAG3134164.1 hypothetical protein PI126_g18819 [Phytophthora idaei]